MENTERIIANIKKTAASLIVSEILNTGISKVHNAKACIAMVKTVLHINLKENENGYLVFT